MTATENELIRREKRLRKNEEAFEKRRRKFENLYVEKESAIHVIWGFFFKNIGWLFLVISFALFAANNIYWHESKYYSLIEKIGMTILSTGVFATILKSFQFTGLFQQEIRKVMLGTDFIENRKDIIPLWKKVSRRLYNDRFPDISSKVEAYVLDTYFPLNNEYYYDNVFYHIQIESLSEDYLLTYIQSWKADVVLAEGVQKTCLTMTLSIDQDKDAEMPSSEILLSKVNNEDVDLKEDESTIEDKFKSLFKVDCKRLPGKDFGTIEIKNRRVYSMKEDNVKTFKSSTFVKNMNVIINYPENVHVNFINVGNKKAFEKHSTDSKNMLHRTFIDDVLFPYQGWGISLKRKKD